jgi:hypothetical protein
VIGPNTSPGITCVNDTPGDPDLTALAGQPTYDAAVLEFEFVPTADRIFLQYVFSSDEYNEYIGSINDVFAFFVNGVNYATVGDPPVPVAINTVNRGRPDVPPTNPEYFRNNSPFTPTYYGEICPPGGCINTEMDGLTVVLTFEAPVNPGATNHIKLAIADASDRILDSNVFIRSGSLTVTPPDDPIPACIPLEAAVISANRLLPRGTVTLRRPFVAVGVLGSPEMNLPSTFPALTADDVRVG